MELSRYAIYYAPAARTALWEQASRWLGRDAVSGVNLRRLLVPSISDIDLDHLTRSPRHYGFHATLKAPFELAPQHAEKELLEFAASFAERTAPFNIEIGPCELGTFLALRLLNPSDQMTALHTECVKAFDHFRAPLNEWDIKRRQKSNLSEVQASRLLEWGYPYIFDEFRFHMTLTGRIDDEVLRSRVLDALRAIFGNRTECVDGIAVFHQADRESAFTVLERFAFKSDVTAS